MKNENNITRLILLIVLFSIGLLITMTFAMYENNMEFRFQLFKAATLEMIALLALIVLLINYYNKLDLVVYNQLHYKITEMVSQCLGFDDITVIFKIKQKDHLCFYVRKPTKELKVYHVLLIESGNLVSFNSLTLPSEQSDYIKIDELNDYIRIHNLLNKRING